MHEYQLPFCSQFHAARSRVEDVAMQHHFATQRRTACTLIAGVVTGITMNCRDAAPLRRHVHSRA